MLAPRIKAKKCRLRICRIEYLPVRKFQKGCCIDHEVMLGLEAVEKKKRLEEKRDRLVLRTRKQALKTRRDYVKQAQEAFNAYIRYRDKDQPCICCGRPLGSGAVGSVGGGYDCGHYRSVGSAPHLRFDERNAHAQNKQCNRYGAGRAVDYRLGLIARIGQEAVEQLEAENLPAKWTIEALRAIAGHYRAELRRLRDAQN